MKSTFIRNSFILYIYSLLSINLIKNKEKTKQLNKLLKKENRYKNDNIFSHIINGKIHFLLFFYSALKN